MQIIVVLNMPLLSPMGRLRFMGYPELIGRKDKTFRLSPPPDIKRAVAFGLEDPLPAVLTPGEPGPEIALEVADDVAAKAEQGELWLCELRVLLHERTYQDQVKLFWNGQEVPAEAIRWADWTYQLRPRPGYALGYRAHVDLKHRLLPRVGANVLRVDLQTKDETLVYPVSVDHVELAVEYLPHRCALRPEERFLE